MALTATRSNLKTSELDMKVKWIVVSMKIDRFSKISKISDAKLLPNKAVFLSFCIYYVTFEGRAQI